ncbi:MAG: C-terminal target protein [Flavipsychrobacter sp.]|nr:C-terminal target protein [Flavipsychrobacter sp.]
MKKLLLLLAAGSIAMNVGAQDRRVISTMQGQEVPGDHKINISALHNDAKYMPQAVTPGAHKTTGVGKRWYNYGIYMGLKSQYEVSIGNSLYVDQYFMPIWNDTNVFITYSTGPAHLNMPSTGNVLDPTFVGFNSSLLYGTGAMMQVNASNAYSVDSVVVPGVYYGGSNATSPTTEVDTLRLVFVSGAGGTHASGDNIFVASTSGGHYGSISFLDIPYDSIVNTAVSNNGSVAIAGKMDILLKVGDTSTSKVYAKAYEISPAIPVAAGNWFATSITYKSSEVKPIIHSLPGDTVIGAVAPYTRYNIFRPVVNFWTATDPTTTTSLLPAWAPFVSTDKNEGLFKNWPNYYNGWKDIYVPMWAWSTGGGTGASVLQYTEVGYHLVCPSCADVNVGVTTIANENSIQAVPNPANNEVNITFALATTADVKVTLTNVLGQVVATKTISNTATGKATFNTEALSAGVYVYTLTANGETSTGRVVVAH